MFIAEELLFSERFLWEGKSYVVHIYRHPAKKERCYNPTTLFNRGSRAGAFFYARDRPGDYAVAGQPPIARCPPAGRF